MTKRAYLVWSVGVLAYLVGVLHRTSFGVVGLEATERFGISASALSWFVVLQLLVYAGMQVPAGVLLDRFGAKRLVVAGTLLMALGQVVLALATVLPLAVAARVLVGAGDALIFLSVISVTGAWFPPRRVPVLVQLTGQLGQIGQVLSAVPLAAILHGAGWTPALLSAAGLGVVAAVAVVAVFRERPAAEAGRPVGSTPRGVLAGLGASWREPGTRLGLFSHLGTQFSGTVFGLLWGVPYLVTAQGLPQQRASGLLTVFVVAGVLAAPVFGTFSARHPYRRSYLVLAVIALIAAAWTAVLVVPAPAPTWLLVLLLVAMGLGAPASVVGFDFARTFNPAARQGTAVGMVNVGGFSASLVVALGVGVLLDALGGYTPEAFRVAWLLQYPVWAVGIVGVCVMRVRARRAMREAGLAVPTLREFVRARREARSPTPR